MMDLSKVLAEYLKLAGIHSVSHLSEANKTGAPARINFSKWREEWNRPDEEYSFRPWQAGDDDIPEARIELRKDPSSKFGESLFTGFPIPSGVEAQRHGAGLAGQDVMNNALNTPESNLANAIYKVLYGAGITAAGRNTDYKDGDIGGIAANAGVDKDLIRGLLAATIVDDGFSAAYPEKQWKLRFNMQDGAPGLILNMPVKDIPWIEELFNK